MQPCPRPQVVWLGCPAQPAARATDPAERQSRPRPGPPDQLAAPCGSEFLGGPPERGRSCAPKRGSNVNSRAREAAGASACTLQRSGGQ
jgi:hypothetical protein